MYRFSEFELDPLKRVLSRRGNTVPLTSKVFDTLLFLVEHRDRIVSKDELLRFLWPRTVVEEANLSQNIFMARKALGERAQDHHYIVTIPGKGFRFAAAVDELADEPGAVGSSESPVSSAARPRSAPQASRKQVAVLALAIALAGGTVWLVLNSPKTNHKGADT